MNDSTRQITPRNARIANVVNRSRVDERSSTDERADAILAEAQFIRPAVSSSVVTGAGGGAAPKLNHDFPAGSAAGGAATSEGV